MIDKTPFRATDWTAVMGLINGRRPQKDDQGFRFSQHRGDVHGLRHRHRGGNRLLFGQMVGHRPVAALGLFWIRYNSGI